MALSPDGNDWSEYLDKIQESSSDSNMVKKIKNTTALPTFHYCYLITITAATTFHAATALSFLHFLYIYLSPSMIVSASHIYHKVLAVDAISQSAVVTDHDSLIPIFINPNFSDMLFNTQQNMRCFAYLLVDIQRIRKDFLALDEFRGKQRPFHTHPSSSAD